MDYDSIITYSTGKIRSEALVKEFSLTEQNSKEMNIPPNDVGFATLTLTQRLGEAWIKANEILDSLTKERMDKLSKDMSSTGDDRQAITAFLAATGDLLYDLHIRAWTK